MDNTNYKSKSVPSIIMLLKDTFMAIWESGLNLILSIFFIICLLFVTYFILGILYYLGLNYDFIKINYLFTFRLAYQIILFIITYILGVFAQILLINSLFIKKNNFKYNLSSLKKYFGNFLCLTILINLILLLCTLPFYGGVLLMAFQSQVLGLISVMLAMVLNIAAASYLLFSPYILIEKNQWCLIAIRESYKLSARNIWFIIVNILIVSISLLIVLNLLTFLSLWLPGPGSLLSVLFILPVIIFVFAYLFTLYKYLK